MLIYSLSFLLFFLSVTNAQYIQGLYCGLENCYDVLGATRDSNKSEIAKNYRKLARLYHPDRHRDPDAKEKAEEQFKVITNAYEILKDDDARTDYDYMLDNPEAYYDHYYRYYRRRVAPKVDVRIVIFVTISIISVIQYYSGWQRYGTAIKYFMSVPKYRNQAMEIAKEEGLLNSNEKRSKKSKSELKEELERVIQNIIENKMDIKGAYAKPKITDILWVQLILLPYTLPKYFYWHFSFFWRHTILKQDYTVEEKLYLIRKYLKCGQNQFDGLEEEEKQSYLERKLWIKKNFDEWLKAEQEEMKKQLADNTRYKRQRRYLKKHGTPRLTFDDS